MCVRKRNQKGSVFALVDLLVSCAVWLCDFCLLTDCPGEQEMTHCTERGVETSVKGVHRKNNFKSMFWDRVKVLLRFPRTWKQGLVLGGAVGSVFTPIPSTLTTREVDGEVTCFSVQTTMEHPVTKQKVILVHGSLKHRFLCITSLRWIFSTAYLVTLRSWGLLLSW